MSQDELNARNKQLKESNALLDKAVKLARQEAQLRKEVSESIGDYLKGVEKAQSIKKQYLENLKKEKQYQEEIGKGTEEEKAAALVKLEIIQKTNAALKKQFEDLNKALDSVNKKEMLFSKLGAEAVKGFAKLPGLLQSGFGKIKDSGLFEMDKSIRMSSLSMGLLGKQADGFRGNIKAASWEASQVGVSLEELTEMQASYSEELGRTVVLTKEGSVAMAQMSKDTLLGAEGAAKLSAEFDSQGLSVERTAKYMNETMDSSHKLGLNAQKVIKNIAGNIKLLNRYNFKDGVAGLAKMAQTVSKLGVSMEFAAGFADKLWDVEGAVDMAAQLQVMGGEWSKLADPFQLMYKARNDIQGLTEDLGKAAAASAHLNKKGEIEISAMEMHKLKIIAQQTGIAYDELAQAGKNAYKLTKIKTQVQFNMSDEEKEFLANTAQLDKDGKAYIEVDGDKKFLGALGSAGKDFVKAQMAAKEAQGVRAKDAQTFDDALSNTIMGMKQYLLPMIESINKNLLPKLGEFGEKFEKEHWGEKISAFATVVGDLVSTVGGWIIEWPKLSAGLFLFAKALPTLLTVGKFFTDTKRWFSNGVSLAEGFNSAAGGGGKGGSSGSGSSGGAGGGKSNWKTAGKGALGGLAVGAVNMALNDDGFSGKGIGEMIGGVLGGAAGTFLDPFIGPLGTMLGAQLGTMLGGYVGGMFGEEANDGVFPSVGSGLGSDFSKDRGIIQGGKIHPIDNKDDLMAMKPGGVVDNAMGSNQQTVNRVEFSDITINGEIRIVSPGSPGLSIDLLKDQGFRREITRTIQVELEKNKVGGKNKG